MSYDSLLTTLDALRTEAPETFKSYHPRRSNLERMNQARARALIHLFLKVRFGILDFNARHALICEGAQDGGVDAYYIDPDTRIIYLLQSKFPADNRDVLQT